jgi:site-specific DNA recombinase
MTRHAAVYCRLSPRPDGRYEGVDVQERWGRDYAASAWPDLPVEVFADSGISAANGDHRPEYERLREWLADGRIAHVWCVEQSRLERREVEWFTLAAELDAAGISEVHTNRDGIVRVRDEVAGIKAVLAAGEVRKLKRRVKDRLDEIAAQGRPHGGQTFGYRRAVDEDGGKTLAIVPDEAKILTEAASKILVGNSLSAVAAGLTDRGIRGRNGKPITYSTLRKMLTNPTVAGQRVHRGRVVGPGVWEPIIDPASWDALKAKLSRPRAVKTSDGETYEITASSYGHSTRSRRRYLLTGGIAVCGKCGAPLKAQRRKVKGRRLDALYFCPSGFCVGIMADGLEDHVRDVLLDELDKSEFLEAVASGNHADRRDEIATALVAVDGQRRALAEMWASAGELTDAEWQTARRALAEREHALRRELAELPPPLVDLDIADVRAAWPDMTIGERREVTAMFITRVTVARARPGTRAFDPGRVDIAWRTL